MTTKHLLASLKAIDKEQAKLDNRRAALDTRIGRHVATLRSSTIRRVTLKQVAAHIGSGIKYPWSLERGEGHWTPETLRRVAAFLEGGGL